MIICDYSRLFYIFRKLVGNDAAAHIYMLLGSEGEEHEAYLLIVMPGAIIRKLLENRDEFGWRALFIV